MAITLTHYEAYDENKELELTVTYDRFDQIWLEIIGVSIAEKKEVFTEGVGNHEGVVRTNIFDLVHAVSELEVAIEEIANRVDWRELYTETVNQ